MLHPNWYCMGSHFNPCVEVPAGGLLVSKGFYSPVAEYINTGLKNTIWIELSRVKNLNSFQNEGFSPSCIALSFDGFVSIYDTLFCFFFSPIYSLTLFRISVWASLTDLLCKHNSQNDVWLFYTSCETILQLALLTTDWTVYLIKVKKSRQGVLLFHKRANPIRYQS
jgi:hypothetical protein